MVSVSWGIGTSGPKYVVHGPLGFMRRMNLIAGFGAETSSERPYGPCLVAWMYLAFLLVGQVCFGGLCHVTTGALNLSSV